MLLLLLLVELLQSDQVEASDLLLPTYSYQTTAAHSRSVVTALIRDNL